MMNFALFLALLCVLFASVFASTRLGGKTLVLVDDADVQNTHSDFLQTLDDIGHTVTVSNVKQDALVIKNFDKYLYDNIIVFASRTEELGGGYIRTPDLIDFIDNGGSVLVAANSNGLAESHRALANTYGVDFDENESFVADAQNVLPVADAMYTSSDDTRPILSVPVPANAPVGIVGASTKSRTLLFRGIGQIVAPNSKFVRSVLSGAPSSVTLNTESNTVLASGPSISLVSAVQTAANSRVLFSGSTDIFSNEFFSHPDASNRELLTNALQWLVHAKGYLRVNEMRHYKASEGAAINGVVPTSYRLKDDIVYETVLEEYDGKKHQWVPYITHKALFQAIMIDPYVRANIPFSAVDNRYKLEWRAPDVHGVYKFEFSINQFAQEGAEGVGFIDAITTVPIRPFRHDEYPRFVFVAYPYYIGVFSIMAAFFVFTTLFLYSK